MGSVLAFSGSVRAIAQENMQNEYLIMRNRIEKMLERVKAEEFAVRYILGYLDANFSRSSHVDLHKLLDAKTVAPAIKKKFFFSLYGTDISTCSLFEGVASSCLREVCADAASIENYFAGHCIQNMNCPLDSWFYVLSGTVVLGDHKALIPGEVAFAQDAFSRVKLANHHLVAFTRAEIVRINIKKFNELLELYPTDKQSFETNCTRFFTLKQKEK